MLALGAIRKFGVGSFVVSLELGCRAAAAAAAAATVAAAIFDAAKRVI